MWYTYKTQRDMNQFLVLVEVQVVDYSLYTRQKMSKSIENKELKTQHCSGPQGIYINILRIKSHRKVFIPKNQDVGLLC